MGWTTYTFLANNIDTIYGNAVTTNKSQTAIPNSAVYTTNGVAYGVIDKGVICNDALHDLFFALNLGENVVDFDWGLYYAIYHTSIEYKYAKHELSIEEKTVLYFIKYGYWYDMKIPNISIEMTKDYRASYSDLMQLSIIDAKHHLLVHKRPILFSTWTYFASNYEYLKHLPASEVADHYVTNSSTRLEHDSFDGIKFLCKYPRAISIILNKEYDMSLLTSATISKFYIENISTIDTYKGDVEFDAFGFVKEFLKDERINKEQLMSVNNAHVYFVKGFVEHKDIRDHIKRAYVLKRFAKKRLRDALRQVPFGILRYMIEFKLYL